MKKIKHISQLYTEQLRLRQHEEDLEKDIRKDWKEVKESILPKNLGRKILSVYVSKKLKDRIKSNGILSGSLSYAAVVLTKKLVERLKKI